jgi:hypothetical protein
VAACTLACAGRSRTLPAQPQPSSVTPRIIGVPPPRFADALPAGYELHGARGGYFMDGGHSLWAVAWTQPDEPATPPTVHLGVIEPHAGSPWTLLWSTAIPTANPTHVMVQAAGLGVPDGFALSLPVGEHGARLLVYRWDGNTFSPVVDRSSGLPEGVDLKDLEDNGTPVVVRTEPALCFHNWADGARIRSVFRWDGSRYAEATRAFAEVINLMAADLAEERANDYVIANATPVQQACFSGVEAYIAQLRGDPAGAAQACAQLQVLAPGWTAPPTWEVPVC